MTPRTNTLGKDASISSKEVFKTARDDFKKQPTDFMKFSEIRKLDYSPSVSPIAFGESMVRDSVAELHNQMNNIPLPLDEGYDTAPRSEVQYGSTSPHPQGCKLVSEEKHSSHGP